MEKQLTAADIKMFELVKEEEVIKEELTHHEPESLTHDKLIGDLHDNYDYQRILKPDLTLPLLTYYNK